MTATTGGLRGRAGKPPPSAVHSRDLVRLGLEGLGGRRLRSVLSALGIAIGIAAMVAVLGISESSRQELLSSLDRLGTNVLTVQSGEGFGGGDGELPATAEPMLERVGPVTSVSAVTSVEASVLRTDAVPEGRTSGLSVKAVDVDLLDALAAEVADGEWLDDVRGDLPVTVLGSVAAERLGVTTVANGVQVWLGGQWFTVVGILEPVELAADIDRAALVGEGVAQAELAAPDTPESLVIRTEEGAVEDVADVVARTADPADPDTVEVDRPTDAIEARAAADLAFTGLFLGLGAVALLVGGVGIANVMVISVLERRSEIGLRRALGATRRHVSTQFLVEALLLSAAGGVAGVALGSLVTAGYGLARGWEVVVPLTAVVGGVVAALVIGAIAGLYPARRAATLEPTDALRTV